LLAFAASLNNNSEHPLATAILENSRERDIDIPEVQGFEAILGKGVTGVVAQKRIAVGNKKLMEDEKAELSDALQQEVAKEQSLGSTVSYISVDGNAEGYLVISDAIKPGSKAAIHELMNAGVD